MDVVTHAMMGAIAASPLLESHPEAACAFALGAVAPDLDAFSRLLGKRAFMRAHQTYTHAYPIIAATGLAFAGLLMALGVEAWWQAGLGLALGMAFHATLDWTNTFGITLLAPFSSRRWCTEWVFFIDAVVLASSIIVLGVVAWRIQLDAALGWKLQAAYGLGLLAYWIGKAMLRARAMRVAPAGTLAMMPSALVPWRFLGCARAGDRLQTFRVSALEPRLVPEAIVELLDGPYLERLRALPEYRAMAALTPAYHVVAVEDEGEGQLLRVRDLRTRNFATRFGALDVHLDGSGAVQRTTFHA